MALKINEHPILPGVSAGIRSADARHQGHFELCRVRAPVLEAHILGYTGGLHPPSPCPALGSGCGVLRDPLWYRRCSAQAGMSPAAFPSRQTGSRRDRAPAQPKFLAPLQHRELPSGLNTPGNGAQHPQEHRQGSGQDCCTTHPVQGQTGQCQPRGHRRGEGIWDIPSSSSPLFVLLG